MCNKNNRTDLFGTDVAEGDYVMIDFPFREGLPKFGIVTCTDQKFKSIQYRRLDLKTEKVERKNSSQLLKLSAEQVMMLVLRK